MPENIILISAAVSISYLKELASGQFADMIKAVIDVEKENMAVGGSLHADEEKLLLQHGSKQQDLWGINIYFDVDEADRIEFDSMINIKPGQGNRSRCVEDEGTREKIISIVNRFIHP